MQLDQNMMYAVLSMCPKSVPRFFSCFAWKTRFWDTQEAREPALVKRAGSQAITR